MERHAPRPSDKDLQRSVGSCRIVMDGTERGNQIRDVFQRSPVRVFFLQVERTGIDEAVLINTSGGIAGGDRLDTAVTAAAGASIRVTSQTAERIYRALDDPARISTTLSVCDAAKLAWCPQETIVFDRARVRRDTHIALASGAELLALEWVVLGRAAYGETVAGGEVIDSWRVEKDGRLVWADSLRITDDVFPRIRRDALLGQCTAVGTLIYFGSNLEKRLECVRLWSASLACRAAATIVGGLIIVRLTAPAGSALRAGLRSVLEKFGHALGRPFGVPKMWSC